MSKEISNERKELVLPRDVSFALKSLLEGRDGMCIQNDSIELLEKDSKEFIMLIGGVERKLDTLEMDERIFENLKSMSRAVASGEIPNIRYQYKLDDYFSVGFKSVMLLTGIDYWDILWKGYGYHYFSVDINGKYDEYYNICNKIHFMTKIKGSKYDINKITMDDINNYTLPL
jgi:hypothetical protein